MGIPIVSVIIALIRVIESTAYAMQCSEIYGADIRYFINTGLTEVRVIYVVSTFIIILHPIIIVLIFKNNKQWKWKVLIWLLIALWGQTVVYTVNIKKATLWNTGIIGFMMCAGFVADGIIDYLIFKIFFTDSMEAGLRINERTLCPKASDINSWRLEQKTTKIEEFICSK